MRSWKMNPPPQTLWVWSHSFHRVLVFLLSASFPPSLSTLPPLSLPTCCFEVLIQGFPCQKTLPQSHTPNPRMAFICSQHLAGCIVTQLRN